MSRAPRIALLCGGLLLLAACGQRGALYLPDSRGEAVARPAASPAPTPEEEEKARQEAARRSAGD